MREELENQLNMATSHDMVEKVTYTIWGSIMVVSKSFRKCQIKIDPMSQRIFAKITLSRWGNFWSSKKVKDRWLKDAYKQTEEFVPSGFKLLIYYERWCYE